MALVRRNNTGRQLGGDRSSLLDHRITEKHGHHIFVVVKESITINVAQVPNLAQLVLFQACADELHLGDIGGEVTALWSEFFKTRFEAVRRVLQGPA